MASADPFGLADLRAATLQTWRSSPTRFAEDVAAERDLVTVGYRDRLFTELAANAADAASAMETVGKLAIWAEGRELHVANTGAPLTEDGVRSLLALRVSAKSSDDDHPSVGRFGVGFTATAAVADRVEMRSRTGSIVFDQAESADAAQSVGVDAADAADAPLLRLAWPADATPAAGFDTEITLHLSDGVVVDELLESARSQAAELMLELPALSSITVGENEFSVTRTVGPNAVEVRVEESGPRGSAVRDWVEVARGATRWLVEIGSAGPIVVGGGVLHAPTPTDIDLSLPAWCITGLPLTPDRRHLHPEADIATAATGYADLLAALPGSARPEFIPRAADAVGHDDAVLIDAVIAELRERRWLPAVGGEDLIPNRAVVFADLSDELAEVLEPVAGDLAHPDVSERRHITRLRSVGVTEIGLADLAERLIGVEREPGWWAGLYAALSPYVGSAGEVEELGALPIPRADGRMNIGARGLFVADHLSAPVRWIPMVHPDARHPLLERLGAQPISVEEALRDPALADLVEHVDDEEAGDLADEVLTLAATDPEARIPEALSALLLPDEQGDLRPADELLLPDSPIRAVLVEDAPYGVVANSVVDRHGPEILRRLGVGWGFLVVRDDLPVAPDHDLPDESAWWDSLAEPPESLAAVRDLDLVDDDRWPQVFSLLVEDEDTVGLLADRVGYTAWWLRHHALVDGHVLGWYRAPSDIAVAGVRDALEHPYADELSAALGGAVVESRDDADTLLSHLADPDRVVAPGVAAATHAAIVAACRRGLFDPADLAVPQRVRTVSGDAVERGVVVDHPWLAQVLDPSEMVLAGRAVEPDDAELLAEILDLPTASDELVAAPREPGDAVSADSTQAVLDSVLTGREPTGGECRLHDQLWIRLQRNNTEHDVRVSWWMDDHGILHLESAPTASR
ncbi:sacsin N-terminal ATP-binding-like domain-containing protein [Gordonia sp. NPDC003424]